MSHQKRATTVDGRWWWSAWIAYCSPADLSQTLASGGQLVLVWGAALVPTRQQAKTFLSRNLASLTPSTIAFTGYEALNTSNGKPWLFPSKHDRTHTQLVVNAPLLLGVKRDVVLPHKNAFCCPHISISISLSSNSLTILPASISMKEKEQVHVALVLMPHDYLFCFVLFVLVLAQRNNTLPESRVR